MRQQEGREPLLILGAGSEGLSHHRDRRPRPINTPVTVQDRMANFNTFGSLGTLSRSVEESATYSDNVIVLRLGATPIKQWSVEQMVFVSATSVW